MELIRAYKNEFYVINNKVGKCGCWWAEVGIYVLFIG